ncbi:serine hydrolase domain-containing protein [Plantactinospora sp. CA-294935]|uniref:serine hydrolase domain-containing protein n=1 Tax=Plantactinospora sp. CA-294935 TaxID=3240012 RepID=UPI003D93FC9C
MNDNHSETVGRRAFLRHAGLAAGTAAVLPALGTAWHGTPAYADTGSTGSGRIPPELRPGGAFDTFVAQLAAEDRFAGTLVLVHQDQPVLERSYGMADRSRSIPHGPDTIFSLASVTKLLTGIAIAQLVERGELSYGDKLGSHLDGFAPEIAENVTIHQLLTHTSGLGDYMRVDGFWAEAETWDSVEEAWEGNLRYVRRDTLGFAPGSGHQYSNSGFVALGAIVARLSGQPGGEHRGYYEHVREHIFRPAGTTRSDFFTAPQWRADRRIAHPYVQDENGEPVDVIDDRQTFVGTPAGGSFGTVGDLVRIVRALQRGRLLDPVYAQLASSPKVPRAQSAEDVGAGRPMGFGNYLTVGSLRNNQWVLGHGGGAPGVSAHVQWFPDSGWVTAVLGNYHRAAEPVAERARELIVG